MKDFATDREALDYLSSRIASEADRQNTPLSEVERKMLYFSETDWTLRDMAAVNAEFERDYDEDEYERKIAGLVRKIETHDHNDDQGEEANWDAAVEKLSNGDRYLLVLVNPLLSESGSAGRPPHDILKLWLTAFGIVFGLFALVALGNWLVGPRFGTIAGWFIEDRERFGLIVVCVVLIWYFGPKLRDVLGVFINRK
jgi:hypothetical protein